MMKTVRKFGLEYCDVETMLWNVSVMLRALILNIDGRNETRIPIFFYILAVSVCLCYFYVYLVSMVWFVCIRCPATGDLLAAIVVFSLGVTSEIGTVKLIYMVLHIDKVREIVSECLACDSSVVAGSRFSNNLLSTLRKVKKRALVFWMVIIGNGVVYIIKPLIMPGRHFTDDKFILFVEKIMRKWRNVRDYYIKEKKIGAKSKLLGVQKKKKKYNYYDSLSFLDDVLKQKRRAKDNSSGDEMIEEYLEVTPTGGMITYEEYRHCEEEDSNQSSSTTASRTIKLEKEETMTSNSMLPFETHIVAPADRIQEDENVKANKNFLLSLLPDVTSLDGRQNMRFRIGVLNLLNDIKFELK